MPRRLHRIRVEQHALFPADRADLADRQDRPDLVVGVHQAHQAGVRPDGVCHLLRRDRPNRADRQELDLKAVAPQLVQRVEHGVVLKGRGDDVPLAPPRADGRR